LGRAHLGWPSAKKQSVLVATANDIEALASGTPAQRRFDEIFFVDLPSEAVRKAVFEIHLKKTRPRPE